MFKRSLAVSRSLGLTSCLASALMEAVSGLITVPATRRWNSSKVVGLFIGLPLEFPRIDPPSGPRRELHRTTEYGRPIRAKSRWARCGGWHVRTISRLDPAPDDR